MNVLCWCPFVHSFDTPFQNSPYDHVYYWLTVLGIFQQDFFQKIYSHILLATFPLSKNFLHHLTLIRFPALLQKRQQGSPAIPMLAFHRNRNVYSYYLKEAGVFALVCQ